jgi:hypothetical protein
LCRVDLGCLYTRRARRSTCMLAGSRHSYAHHALKESMEPEPVITSLIAADDLHRPLRFSSDAQAG